MKAKIHKSTLSLILLSWALVASGKSKTEKVFLTASESREMGFDVIFDGLTNERNFYLFQIDLPEGKHVGQIFNVTAEVMKGDELIFEFPVQFDRYRGDMFTGLIYIWKDRITDVAINIQSHEYIDGSVFGPGKVDSKSKVFILKPHEFLESKDEE